MPSSPGYVRNYAQERITAIKRGDTGVGKKSKDAMRHRARREMEKSIGRKLPTSVHVDHKKTVKDGGSNDRSNLRLRDASENMSAGGKSGSSKGKAAGGRKGAKSRLPVSKPKSKKKKD
ncbi:hypothetical protein [Salmonella phage PKM.Hi.22.6]|uniref:HNH nuclease domain-containing protein n=1 Tax=phage PKM.Lu.22.1 TaxID=3049197 RepID=A0AAF0KYS2_9CAUD|nr:hypothetical protein [phage PKM.Lu.22.1]WKV17112.1 hypothetical protein [Salmonella phage PKM.Hi.22.6]